MPTATISMCLPTLREVGNVRNFIAVFTYYLVFMYLPTSREVGNPEPGGPWRNAESSLTYLLTSREVGTTTCLTTKQFRSSLMCLPTSREVGNSTRRPAATRVSVFFMYLPTS